MTSYQNPSEIAAAFIEAFGRRDIETVGTLIADDIVFESPRLRLVGAEAFLETVGQFAQLVDKIINISVLGDHERAMIMYEMQTGPFGTVRAVDHLAIRDGKIVSDVLVFDTYDMRTAMESQSSD
jgi:ketosteroid isomerase-like protein